MSTISTSAGMAAAMTANDDAEMAKKLGRTKSSVMHRRYHLGLPSTRRVWAKKQIALLGTMSDVDLARRIGVKTWLVTYKRRQLKIPYYTGPKKSAVPWAEEEVRLLGRIPDAEVARRIGRAVTAVKARRQMLRIPSADPHFRFWTQDEEKLLGKATDREIGQRLNRTTLAVTGRRRALNIPGWRVRKR